MQVVASVYFRVYMVYIGPISIKLTFLLQVCMFYWANGASRHQVSRVGMDGWS